MPLFYIEYGCSLEHAALVAEATHEGVVIDYAQQAAEDSFYSYSCNYVEPDDYPNATEEELAEIQEEEMQYDIFHSVVAFNPKDETHKEALKEQDNKPYVI